MSPHPAEVTFSAWNLGVYTTYLHYYYYNYLSTILHYKIYKSWHYKMITILRSRRIGIFFFAWIIYFNIYKYILDIYIYIYTLKYFFFCLDCTWVCLKQTICKTTAKDFTLSELHTKSLLDHVKSNKILIVIILFGFIFTKLNSVHCQMNRKSAITIKIWFRYKRLKLVPLIIDFKGANYPHPRFIMISLLELQFFAINQLIIRYYTILSIKLNMPASYIYDTC